MTITECIPVRSAEIHLKHNPDNGKVVYSIPKQEYGRIVSNTDLASVRAAFGPDVVPFVTAKLKKGPFTWVNIGSGGKFTAAEDLRDKIDMLRYPGPNDEDNLNVFDVNLSAVPEKQVAKIAGSDTVAPEGDIDLSNVDLVTVLEVEDLPDSPEVIGELYEGLAEGAVMALGLPKDGKIEGKDVAGHLKQQYPSAKFNQPAAFGPGSNRMGVRIEKPKLPKSVYMSVENVA